MPRNKWFAYFASLAALILAIPFAAQAANKPLKMDLNLDQSATIAGTKITLKPGDYRVEAFDDVVVVEQNGKQVASIPAHWKTDTRKADNSEFTVTGDHKLTEIHFEGRTKYLTFM